MRRVSFLLLLLWVTALAGLSRYGQRSPSMVAAPAAGEGQAACPVTRPPTPPFSPPPPYLANSPYESDFWYGTPDLWTLIPSDGVWRQLPHDSRGYTQKTFWWQQGYDWQIEPAPDLIVSGRRLLGEALTISAEEATNGFHPDTYSFMLAGIVVPEPGCWLITASRQDHSLSYVVWITP